MLILGANGLISSAEFVKFQNIGEHCFSRPSSLDSMLRRVARLRTCNRNMTLVIEIFRWMQKLDRICISDQFCLLVSLTAICCVPCQLAAQGVKILLGELEVGVITQTKTKIDIPEQNAHFKVE